MSDDATISTKNLARALNFSPAQIRNFLAEGFLQREGINFSWSEAVFAAFFAACAPSFQKYARASSEAAGMAEASHKAVQGGESPPTLFIVAETLTGDVVRSGALDWQDAMTQIAEATNEYNFTVVRIVDPLPCVQAVTEALEANKAKSKEQVKENA